MAQAAVTLPTLREAKASMEQVIRESVSSASTEDPGLFGPHSVSWKICRNPAFAISALAGLLMAALHPTAMAAIDQHSDYRRDAWRRAQRTTAYVFMITFGATPHALQAAARVRGVHQRLEGEDSLSGRRYRADDPDLLLWVHCVNTKMALAGHRAFGGGLTPADSDRYVEEQVRAAALVGLDEGEVPRTEAALDAWLEGAALRAVPAADEFADLLMTARMPWTMRPFWALHVVGAAMILPPGARAHYRLPAWLPRSAAARLAIRSVLRLMDLSYWLLPPVRRARRHLDALARRSEA
jgi:uncharacterized protein (DUF2236 family)